MGSLYATAASALTLLAACDASRVRRVEIVAHYVPACAPDTALEPAQLELVALGDFDRSNDSVSILESGASLQALALPDATRAAELSTLAERSYWGAGALDTHNQIPILLWPRDRACRLLSTETGPTAPDAGVWQLGTSSRLSRALVLGPTSADAAPEAYALDLRDASVAQVDMAAFGSLPSYTSISELGEGFLVAGGEDPAAGSALASAGFLDPRIEPLGLQPLELERPRSRHAALSLPSGSSMLIGGEAAGQALASVEILTPDGRAARLIELLATPRIAPRALLLGGGRILVGGGYVWTTDGASRTRQAVPSVEFLSTDLADVTEEPIPLEPAALDRAFVALAAGAALAVGGCGPVTPSADCVACEGGAGCVSREVWWIDPQGTSHALDTLPEALRVAEPALVPAAEGAPFLIAGDALGRFDPWRARFDVVAVALPGPRGTLVSEPRALGPGAFAWLRHGEGSVDLLGMYHNQRARFTQDVAPLLVGSGRGVFPHRPPSSDASDDTALRYSVANGLTLSGSAAVASIADTDYTEFTLSLTLRSGPAPLLRLVAVDAAADDGASFGGLDCPWPDFQPPALETASPGVRLGVTRRGDDVRLSLESPKSDEAEPEPCHGALPDRVGIQIVGTRAGTTELSRIEIRRTVD